MASLKVIRKRIASVKSTQQITKAMKMVSAAKLRRAQEAATQARPYADKLGELMRNVAARAEEGAHPLLATPEEEKTTDLLLVTSDRGLCGGFNSNLVRKAEAFIRERSGGTRVRLTVVGRKGFDYFKRRDAEIVEKQVNLLGGPDHALAMHLARGFARSFSSRATDSVYVLYMQFCSALSQTPTLERLLPIGGRVAETGTPTEYIYEPNLRALLDRLLLQSIVTRIDHAFLESIASEHGSRMTAMDSATNNASDMIDRLTLQMNRARQAAITTELMEIVGGAEALKG